MYPVNVFLNKSYASGGRFTNDNPNMTLSVFIGDRWCVIFHCQL